MSARPLDHVVAAEPEQLEVVTNKTAIEHQAEALIHRAAAVGLNVAIETRPLQPLAMSHYELVVNVWERR